jgi:hypothetical protein
MLVGTQPGMVRDVVRRMHTGRPPTYIPAHWVRDCAGTHVSKPEELT